MDKAYKIYSKYVDKNIPNPVTEVYSPCQQGEEDIEWRDAKTKQKIPKKPFVCVLHTSCVLGLFEITNDEVDENGMFCGTEVLTNDFGSTLTFMIKTIKTQH